MINATDRLLDKTGNNAAVPLISSRRALAAASFCNMDTLSQRSLLFLLDPDAVKSRHLWTNIKYTDLDLTQGRDTHFAFTNDQLGYDHPTGKNAYRGAYIGTIRGALNSDSPNNLNSSLELGLYGTKLLNPISYASWLLHYARWNNAFMGADWRSENLGLNLEYGVKIQQGKNSYLVPYTRLGYNHFAGENAAWQGNTPFSFQNSVSLAPANALTFRLGAMLSRHTPTDTYFMNLAYDRFLHYSEQVSFNNMDLPAQQNRQGSFLIAVGLQHQANKATSYLLSLGKSTGLYNGWPYQVRANWLF